MSSSFPRSVPRRRAPIIIGRGAQLTRLAEELGYTNVRTVEHYFDLRRLQPRAAHCSRRCRGGTQTMRLMTGAVLPVFNHPLKLAGEIGMVDAMSSGRLEVGFARAFLPHEFARFGISPG